MKALLVSTLASLVLLSATAAMAGPPASRPFEKPSLERSYSRSDGMGHQPRTMHYKTHVGSHASAGGGGHNPRTMHEKAPVAVHACECGC